MEESFSICVGGEAARVPPAWRRAAWEQGRGCLGYAGLREAQWIDPGYSGIALSGSGHSTQQIQMISTYLVTTIFTDYVSQQTNDKI